jgi:hypothetical protein
LASLRQAKWAFSAVLLAADHVVGYMVAISKRGSTIWDRRLCRIEHFSVQKVFARLDLEGKGDVL